MPKRRMSIAGKWMVDRNTYLNPDFTPEDFTAFLLVAGVPPDVSARRGSVVYFDIDARLNWLDVQEQFKDEYFAVHYPNEVWADFVREFKVWHRWQCEKETVPTISEATTDHGKSNR